MATQEALEYIGKFPDGVTLTEFKHYFKKLTSRYGLEDKAYVMYDQLAIDILETASAIKLVVEPGEPTRLIATEGELENE